MALKLAAVFKNTTAGFWLTVQSNCDLAKAKKKAKKPEDLLFTPAQAPYILSQPLHSSQKVLSDDEKGLKIQLEVYLSHELRQSILGFGDRVRVLKPVGLRKEIVRILKGALKRYSI